MLVVLCLVLLHHVHNVLVKQNLQDFLRHRVEVAHALFGLLSLGHVFRVQIRGNLLAVRLIMRIHVYDFVDLGDVVQIEEEIRHVDALFRQRPELVLTIQESQLFHLVQVQIALVVVLEQALEDQVLLAVRVVSRRLLRATGSQRVLVLDDLEQAEILRVLFLHNLVNHAPFRKACQLGLPQVLQEAVGFEIDDAVQAPLLALQNLHPVLDELLYLLLLLFDVEFLLVELELVVLLFNLIDDFLRD
jgi:hypothetical protein